MHVNSEAIYTRKLCHVTAAVEDTSQFHSVNTDTSYLLTSQPAGDWTYRGMRPQASQPASQNSACMITRQIRKIQSIFVHAVHARRLPAWLAAEMGRSSDFDPRARRQAVACAQN